MRKRRKTKYTWLQTLPGDDINEGEGLVSVGISRSIPVQSDLTTATDVFPVIADRPDDISNAGDQMVNFIGTNIFLKRIVGKLYIQYQQNASNVSPPPIPSSVIVTAGFFIARADDTQDQPIGASVNLYNDYSPDANQTQREPWIWRRTWLLGNNGAVPDSLTGNSQPGAFFPASNAARSVLDGPHIDAKTARRTQSDERLFFALTTRAFTTVQAQTDGQIEYYLDCRYLGALRRQRNHSAF